MTKKTEGWSDPFACFVEGPEKPDEIYCSFFPTTQVVHDGDKHERVFTESEVKVMMEDVKAIAAEHSRKCYTNRIEQMTPPEPVAFLIDNYLWKSHDFSSDHA